MELKKNWKPILNRLSSKLLMWKAKSLSFGGNLTLVKSVFGSLPTYYMLFFKSPQGTIDEFEKIKQSFLWGGDGDLKKKIHWVDWSRVIAPKSVGGLGVGTILTQNTTLLKK